MGGLPQVQEREHLHTRRVVSHGYLRADDLWDIETEVHDTKSYGTINGGARVTGPGDGIHIMKVLLILDEQLTVVDAVSVMPGVQFPECRAAGDPLRSLFGATVGRGWRKANRRCADALCEYQEGHTMSAQKRSR